MPGKRGPKGTGRVQTTTRANTVKRKEAWLASQMDHLDQEELIGIAQGILCDGRVNYMEAPFLGAAKSNIRDGAKVGRHEAKAKHKYTAHAGDNWNRKTYKPNAKQKALLKKVTGRD